MPRSGAPVWCGEANRNPVASFISGQRIARASNPTALQLIERKASIRTLLYSLEWSMGNSQRLSRWIFSKWTVSIARIVHPRLGVERILIIQTQSSWLPAVWSALVFRSSWSSSWRPQCVSALTWLWVVDCNFKDRAPASTVVSDLFIFQKVTCHRCVRNLVEIETSWLLVAWFQLLASTPEGIYRWPTDQEECFRSDQQVHEKLFLHGYFRQKNAIRGRIDRDLTQRPACRASGGSFVQWCPALRRSYPVPNEGGYKMQRHLNSA